MRLTAFFTAVCSAIIAGASGAAAHAYLGLGRLHAAAVAAAIMIALTLLQTTGSRIRRGSMLARQLADLSRGGADVARQVAEMDGRLAALEKKVDSALDHSRAVTDQLALEIEELGTLVKQLAETVANQQTVFEAISG
ncbi:MAG: EAL domain-containing protein, partial [bacterium]